MDTSMTPIVLRVAEFRKAKGMSQGELAKRANIRQATLSAIEAGGAWTSDTLERLAKVLAVDPALLLKRTSKRSKGE